VNLMDTVLNAEGGGTVRQLSQQFGLGQDQTVAALKSLLPAVAGGLQHNTSQQGGLESLLTAITSGNHQQYLDNPSTLASESTRQEGNGILGHIFGSKEVSRQVAERASAQTGVGSEVLKSMLPIVAAMAMGALKKGALNRDTAANPVAGGAGEGIMGMISPLLDRNHDGSATDDVLGFVGKLFSR
jgi:hypothetical protein